MAARVGRQAAGWFNRAGVFVGFEWWPEFKSGAARCFTALQDAGARFGGSPRCPRWWAMAVADRLTTQVSLQRPLPTAHNPTHPPKAKHHPQAIKNHVDHVNHVKKTGLPRASASPRELPVPSLTHPPKAKASPEPPAARFARSLVRQSVRFVRSLQLTQSVPRRLCGSDFRLTRARNGRKVFWSVLN